MASGGGVKDGITVNIKRLIARYLPSSPLVQGALYRRAEDIMTVSKERHVPVDLSALKNSGTVHLPVVVGNSVSVELSYGGPSVKYALAVHEHPSKHSPPSWQGKQITFSPAGHGPKYLERPLLAAQRTLLRDLAQDLKFGPV